MEEKNYYAQVDAKSIDIFSELYGTRVEKSNMKFWSPCMGWVRIKRLDSFLKMIEIEPVDKGCTLMLDENGMMINSEFLAKSKGNRYFDFKAQLFLDASCDTLEWFMFKQRFIDSDDIDNCFIRISYGNGTKHFRKEKGNFYFYDTDAAFGRDAFRPAPHPSMIGDRITGVELVLEDDVIFKRIDEAWTMFALQPDYEDDVEEESKLDLFLQDGLIVVDSETGKFYNVHAPNVLESVFGDRWGLIEMKEVGETVLLDEKIASRLRIANKDMQTDCDGCVKSASGEVIIKKNMTVLSRESKLELWNCFLKELLILESKRKNAKLVVKMEQQELEEFIARCWWQFDCDFVDGKADVSGVEVFLATDYASFDKVNYDVLIERDSNCNIVVVTKISSEDDDKDAVAHEIEAILKTEAKYGGIVTQDEWGDENMAKFIFASGEREKYGSYKIFYGIAFNPEEKELLAFHTDVQRKKFLDDHKDLVFKYLGI